ncbi:hypothetical protein CB1_001616028 [Camelus ferus]|nr:hypothetical protein CB1_001616028 [Camelus ferus]
MPSCPPDDSSADCGGPVLPCPQSRRRVTGGGRPGSLISVPASWLSSSSSSGNSRELHGNYLHPPPIHALEARGCGLRCCHTQSLALSRENLTQVQRFTLTIKIQGRLVWNMRRLPLRDLGAQEKKHEWAPWPLVPPWCHPAALCTGLRGKGKLERGKALNLPTQRTGRALPVLAAGPGQCQQFPGRASGSTADGWISPTSSKRDLFVLLSCSQHRARWLVTWQLGSAVNCDDPLICIIVMSSPLYGFLLNYFITTAVLPGAIFGASADAKCSFKPFPCVTSCAHMG